MIRVLQVTREKKGRRVHQRGRAEEIGEINAIARLVGVGGPAHAELEGEAETHGARDMHLRAVDGLHLLLVLLHYASRHLAEPTLDAHLLRLAALDHSRVGLLQQEEGDDAGNTRGSTTQNAVCDEKERTLQREMVVDLGENAANRRSEDESSIGAGVQSGQVHTALLCRN